MLTRHLGPRISRLGALLVLALGLIASMGAEMGAAKPTPVTIRGSGSTLQKAFVDQAIAGFTKARAGVTVSYLGTGSDVGRRDLLGGVVDFAASDAPFPSVEAAKLASPVLYFPTVVAPVAVVFTLSSVPKLQLSGPTISKIFQRQITFWDDLVIAVDNPGVVLPHTPITVVRRSDGSGTTQSFGTFLTRADPSGWKLGAGSTIAWPPDTRGAVGTTGAALLVKAIDGAIGYVGLSDAKAAGLQSAWIRNQLGKYIEPSVSSAAEAAAKAVVNADLTFDSIYAPGAASYPIAAPGYVIVVTSQSDPATTKVLKALLAYIETTGQQSAAKVNFAPLPGALAKRAKAQVAQIQG